MSSSRTALDLPPNSEVIVPANSFIASAEAVTRTGHRVVFCDANAGDYTLDFSGELQRDAVVNIESGISRVVVIVPREMNAKVYFKGGKI